MSSKNPSPDRSSQPSPPGDDRGNLLGALLRLSHQAMMAEVFRSLEGTEFADLREVSMALLRPLWDAPEGVRSIDLARAARVTKQTMGALVDQLERAGYVERVDDASDGRAKLVRLTKRGRESGRLLRAAVRRVEADWARRIGSQRFAALRSALTDLLASLDADRDEG
jgi:DNA-binding MarR family transcriptional regulator